MSKTFAHQINQMVLHARMGVQPFLHLSSGAPLALDAFILSAKSIPVSCISSELVHLCQLLLGLYGNTGERIPEKKENGYDLSIGR